MLGSSITKGPLALASYAVERQVVHYLNYAAQKRLFKAPFLDGIIPELLVAATLALSQHFVFMRIY